MAAFFGFLSSSEEFPSLSDTTNSCERERLFLAIVKEVVWAREASGRRLREGTPSNFSGQTCLRKAAPLCFLHLPPLFSAHLSSPPSPFPSSSPDPSPRHSSTSRSTQLVPDPLFSSRSASKWSRKPSTVSPPATSPSVSIALLTLPLFPPRQTISWASRHPCPRRT